MSDESTKRMLSAYIERAPRPRFLSGFFKSPPENFHNTEEVEIDIERDGEDVAVVVTDLQVGARSNESNIFTNKLFKPPIFDEDVPITAYKLLNRQAGQSPFDNPDFAANALRQAFTGFRKIQNKIGRSIEQMASQVFQTGILTLTDGTNTLYSLDFKPKATHFVTVSTDWAADGLTGDPLGDLASLAEVLRTDGKKDPTKMIFGTVAMERFLANTAVQARLNFRRGDFVQMKPEVRGEGATFRGTIWIDHYEMEMWMYSGRFDAPGSGTSTPYVGTDRVIMLSDEGRLDLTFGAIPLIARPESRAMSFLPTLIADSDLGMSLTTNAYITQDNKAVVVSAGTRPLTIPTAIDTFGALDVIA